MTSKNIIDQVEHLFGRQPQGYMIRLINDALIDLSSKKREYTVVLTDEEAISMKDFAEDITGNYNPYEDFKIIAKQVKAYIDANFKDY